ncbi:MAG: 3-oxoacyl-[acyl-carrier-protein] reductase [Elusimicrobia bacterium]|nr:3-oxoacyl-[acyl-carrier-protein] reductase [Elusimicrobiota bacterium]
MRFQGQVAIVTGGAQGIGRATAELFAAEGAKVVVCDVDESLAAAAAESLKSSYGADALGFKADVASFEACDAVVKQSLDRYGKIDILVNNAGITRDGLLIRMSEADWDLVLNVNLKGVFHFSKAVAKPMMRQRRGRIVNVASIIGQIGNQGQANYAASKGGVIALTKATAKELASRNIIVNAVAPGFIKTRLTDVLPQEVKNKMLSDIPMARFGEPGEVARVILFLASEDAAYMTGQVIRVSGGMVM